MNNRNYFLVGLIAFVFGHLHISEAFAYIDPGAGSVVIQALIGALAGVLISLKVYWHRIREKISR